MPQEHRGQPGGAEPPGHQAKGRRNLEQGQQPEPDFPQRVGYGVRHPQDTEGRCRIRLPEVPGKNPFGQRARRDEPGAAVGGPVGADEEIENGDQRENGNQRELASRETGIVSAPRPDRERAVRGRAGQHHGRHDEAERGVAGVTDERPGLGLPHDQKQDRRPHGESCREPQCGSGTRRDQSGLERHRPGRRSQPREDAFRYQVQETHSSGEVGWELGAQRDRVPRGHDGPQAENPCPRKGKRAWRGIRVDQPLVSGQPRHGPAAEAE